MFCLIEREKFIREVGGIDFGVVFEYLLFVVYSGFFGMEFIEVIFGILIYGFFII